MFIVISITYHYIERDKVSVEGRNWRKISKLTNCIHPATVRPSIHPSIFLQVGWMELQLDRNLPMLPYRDARKKWVLLAARVFPNDGSSSAHLRVWAPKDISIRKSGWRSWRKRKARSGEPQCMLRACVGYHIGRSLANKAAARSRLFTFWQFSGVSTVNKCRLRGWKIPLMHSLCHHAL